MKRKRIKLSDILISGASIKVEKIRNTKEVKRLIQETIEAQEAIIKLKNQPFKNLIITI